MRSRVLSAITAVVCIVALGGLSAPASAATVWSDDRGDAVTSTLPIDDTVTLTDAAVEENEPTACHTTAMSVWTSVTITAPTRVLLAIQDLYWYGPVAGLFPHGSNSATTCVGTMIGDSSAVTLEPGTYDLMVGSLGSFPGDSVHVTLGEILPPANDDVANATALTLPASGIDFDLRAATVQTGESTPCSTSAQGSVWYSFVAPPSGVVTVTSGVVMMTGFSFFTGSSLSSLGYTGKCGNGTFTAGLTPGGHYLLQIAADPGYTQNAVFDIHEAPALTVQIQFSPVQPAAGQEVGVYPMFDGGEGSPVVSCSVDFGDRSPVQTATSCGMIGWSHTFAKDGTYRVTVRGTASDGRRASSTVPLTVVTHDVSVVSIDVPRSVRMGKSIKVRVQVGPTKYLEPVVVNLVMVSESGNVDVGSQTLTLPADRKSRWLTFWWTPTSAGKVTLSAAISITDWNEQDAVPGNNTVTSPTITVKR